MNDKDIRWFSYSQLDTFASCQQKWLYRYAEGWKPQTESRALGLGTLMGELVKEWWTDPEFDPSSVVNDWGVERTKLGWTDEAILETADDALWLLKRYGAVRSEQRKDVRLLAKEFELRIELPRPSESAPRYGLHGFMDLLVFEERHKILGFVEVKTMSQWRRAEILEWDPQLTLYFWMLRQSRLPVQVAYLDAIRTYRWKRDERKHPPEESLRWLPISRTDRELDAFARRAYNMCSAIDLAAGHGFFVPTVGDQCGWCDFFAPCHEMLKGDRFSERAILDESFRMRATRP